jgi:D-alanine--poly(phosphoribitol) ligase subunit 2
MELTPVPGRGTNGVLTNEAILAVVLQAIRNTNLARSPEAQLPVSADAAIFGPTSALDSLGLLTLLMDIEEDLQAVGARIRLSDDRAMSQTRSPFRSVESLVEYIERISRS